jgi:hypothetical protein
MSESWHGEKGRTESAWKAWEEDGGCGGQGGEMAQTI